MNNKLKDTVIIIECGLPDGIGGVYFSDTQIIFVHSITDKSVLVHELIHHFWNMRDETLKRILNGLGLDFTTEPNKAMANKFINDCLNVDLVKEYYEPDEWLEEALAYIMQDLDEDSFRTFHIPLLNRILDNDFYYYDGNTGDMIYYKSGEVVLNSKSRIKRIIDFYMGD